jgi:hypothetical protein
MKACSCRAKTISRKRQTDEEILAVLREWKQVKSWQTFEARLGISEATN